MYEQILKYEDGLMSMEDVKIFEEELRSNQNLSRAYALLKKTKTVIQRNEEIPLKKQVLAMQQELNKEGFYDAIFDTSNIDLAQLESDAATAGLLDENSSSLVLSDSEMETILSPILASQQEITTAKVRKFNIRRILSIAAGVLVLVLGGLGIIINSSTSTDSLLVEVSNVLEKQHGAAPDEELQTILQYAENKDYEKLEKHILATNYEQNDNLQLLLALCYINTERYTQAEQLLTTLKNKKEADIEKLQHQERRQQHLKTTLERIKAAQEMLK